jgi:hypothetical protein
MELSIHPSRGGPQRTLLSCADCFILRAPKIASDMLVFDHRPLSHSLSIAPSEIQADHDTTTIGERFACDGKLVSAI